ncbi:MAG: hypothetical protein RR854_04740 [Muribaculaceae bacterium]
MTKKLYATLFICSLFMSCSSSEHSDEAKQRAILVAEELIKSDPNDEMKQQDIILKAKSAQSEYTLMGDSIAAKEFDIAFREYIEQHNDSLSAIMF